MTLLSVQGLQKLRWRDSGARRDVSVGRGELVALIGPNGAGKTTTFNMVGGQLPPDAGQVILDGEDMTLFTPRQKFWRGVGRTFQVAQTFLSMTVAENVQMALISHHGRARALWPAARRLYRDEALRSWTAWHARGRQPGGGDAGLRRREADRAGDRARERTETPAHGRADRRHGPAGARRLDGMTARVARERGLGVLFTEHDMSAVFSHADRVLVLVRGEIIAAGPPEAVRADPRVQKVYLGESGVASTAQAQRARV